MRRALVLLVLGLVMLPAVGGRAQDRAVARKFLLIARTATSPGSVATAINAAGGTSIAILPDIDLALAESSAPDFLSRVKRQVAIQDAAEDVEVQWISPDAPVTAVHLAPPFTSGVNSEPLEWLQWNLRQIHADETAARGDMGDGLVRARIAIVDNGIVASHPDIASNLNLALSKSFVEGGELEPAELGFSHGTHVAGIAASPINGQGIQGVAPEAELVAVRVLSGESGTFGNVIRGIVYAAGPDVHADVINLSLAATFDRKNAGGNGAGLLLASLNRAITWATRQGSLVVCAAGNDGVDLNGRLFSVPAQSGDGMAVAATGPIGVYSGTVATYDRAASYTNYGASVVDIAAPGGDFVLYPQVGYEQDMVAAPGGKDLDGYYFYALAAGTSMAAPHVSGLAALIVGKYGHLKPAQIRAIIEASADDILKPGTDDLGKGRINAIRALRR